MDTRPDENPGIDPHDPEALQLLDALASALRWARLSGADTVTRSDWADSLRWEASSPASPMHAAPLHSAPLHSAPMQSAAMQSQQGRPALTPSAHGRPSDARPQSSAATTPRTTPARVGTGAEQPAHHVPGQSTPHVPGQSTPPTTGPFSLRLRDRARPLPPSAPATPASELAAAGAVAPAQNESVTTRRPASATKPQPPQWSVEDVRARVDACTGCALHVGCAGRVHAYGPARARLLIVVDGPGREELEAGMPLGAREGPVLAKALAAAGLNIDETFVVPIVRCVPALPAAEPV